MKFLLHFSLALSLFSQNNYKIIKTYDRKAHFFTQGYLIKDNFIYEGTGQYGKSGIHIWNLKTFKKIKSQKNTPNIFGEGITIFNNKLYQLTWKENICYVYNSKTLKKIDEIPISEEGWGLTNDESTLIMSNGSSTIYFLDPDSFIKVRKIEVIDNVGPVSLLNELEYVDGEIYANIYQSSRIIVIDPYSGTVLRSYDFSELSKNHKEQPFEYVLNGIAYNERTKTFFITGKMWNKVYEVKFK
jgi:glutamine cyclotransferase